MKSILITGCNRGLGLGLVKALNQVKNPPKHVFATCRNLEKAEELRSLSEKYPNIHIIETDLKDYDSYTKLVNQVEAVVKDEGLNVLFNNAGMAPKSTRLLATRSTDMIECFITNTLVPVMLTKAFIPLLKKASLANSSSPYGISKAAVINMSSILASIAENNQGGLYSYRASKTGLNAATKSMSIDLKNDNILCVNIHPGWVKTDLGGSKAPLEIDESCITMVETLYNLNESNNGGFVQYDGKSLPW